MWFNDFVQISLAFGTNIFLRNVWRDFRLTKAAYCNGSRESLNGKFTAKNDFFDRVFYFIIVDADIGSLKSFRTLVDKYLDHMAEKFDQNRMVWTIKTKKQNKKNKKK